MPHSDAIGPSLDWCLFLDVDGTLIELTETPFDTRADGGLKDLLRAVSERLGGALALVSGRTIEYLDALFAPLRLPAAGLHGLERRSPSGELHGMLLDDQRLDGARSALGAFVASHAGTLLEDKGRTIAVHFRMAPGFEPDVREAVMAVADGLGTDYQVQSGNMILEIKPRGVTKGGAVTAFLSEPPFAGRRPVYVGDDLTDLDGFRAVDAMGGVSVAVGDRVAGQYRLEDPAAVRSWLADIAGRGAPFA
jgi:trehalose 6-phosphate phosphatase